MEQMTMTAWTIWLLAAIVTVALMLLSRDMASVRGRSTRTWLWIAALTGPLPLAPLLLYALGARSASQS